MNEDKSTRYRRLRRRGRLLSITLVTGVLASLILGSGGPWLRTLAAACLDPLGLSGPWQQVSVAMLAAAVLAALLGCAAVPGAFYAGYWLDRRYGLSRQSITEWVRDHVKAFLLMMSGAVVWAVVLYGSLVVVPRLWWLTSAFGLALLSVLMAVAAPLWLFPLFYGTKPISGALAGRLATLTDRAGVSIVGVHELAVGEGQRWANALLVGVGPTRRILISETLVERLTADEVEVIVAHELGHHVNGDIWKGLAADGLQTLATLFIAHLGLAWLGPQLALSTPADPAGMPVVVLLLGASRVLTTPFFLAALREHERRADHFALELTGNPGAFESAMRRLADQNLIETAPGRAWDRLFRTHPSLDERAALARRWEAGRAERVSA